ncbi:MAG: dihydropyrimidinase [Lachnospiraceae bacterium]|nr:dihydropyrimidinase [Lachnospiraceae bacterium]MDY5741378.1 dihydropyrimidinase [Lachnospiraceae bacterium]
MKKLIRGGTIVAEGAVYQADIVIEDETIAAIGRFPESEFDEIMEAGGMYIFPGFIDPHTHMELQQSPKYRACDDFYSGTVAAAMGGTTMIVDHIAFGPAGCRLHHSIDQYHELAKKAVIDYSFHGVLQHVDDDILKELADIVTNEGIPSFKAYTTYGFKLEDRDLYRVLQVMKQTNGLLTVHCENDAITNWLRQECIEHGQHEPIYHAKSRPNATETEAAKRLMQLAVMADEAPLYIVHTSARESLWAVEDARAQGQQNVYVETCTQYLTLTEEKYKQGGACEGVKYLMAPPLRSQEDQEALWQGLADGSIQVVATDHCPFMLAEKLDGAEDFTKAPGGAPGVEERGLLLYSEGVAGGRISLTRFVELMSTNAAKIFGMYPKKGTLLPGSDADLVIFDPQKKTVLSQETLHSVCDYTPYEGWQVEGGIKAVFARGKKIVEDGRFLGERGDGRFVPRKRSEAI